MTYTHRSRLYFTLLCFLFSERCWSAALSVTCMIINLQYVECTWHPKASEMNYTFSSAFKNETSHKDCPEYILEHSYTIGCRIPLKREDDSFDKFYTNTYIGGNKSVSQAFKSLERYVKLNPPYNLSVEWFEQNRTFVLQWKETRSKCVVYMVHHQTGTNQAKYTNVTGTSYSPSHISPNKRNVFRVRSSISENCGYSDFWSNWSATVEWGSAENITRWQGLLGILPVLLLLLLVCLLCYCERKKITLLPIVPDPSKNLQDLFHKHDGNVESWVYISKELKEAFEPDYTEPSCDVCEVTPPCDVSATPVATPTSETLTCDRINSEEMPAKA